MGKIVKLRKLSELEKRYLKLKAEAFRIGTQILNLVKELEKEPCRKDYVDEVLSCPYALPLDEIAVRDYGIEPKDFIGLLRDCGFGQYPEGLYEVSQKERLVIYDNLKEIGILPEIESNMWHEADKYISAENYQQSEQ